jgi:hypothetical protein
MESVGAAARRRTFMHHNMDTYARDPKLVNKQEFISSDVDGNFHGAGHGFAAANFKATINGHKLGNMPMLSKIGEHVRSMS